MKTLQISDLSFTTGFDSLFASMGRTADFIMLGKLLDEVGFYMVEIASGHTFEVMHQSLNEDPWERIRKLVNIFKRTPVAVRLNSRSFTGFDLCPKDVVEAFVERLAANGVGLVRLCDPLNCMENFKYSAGAAASEGLRIQGILYYSGTASQGFSKEKIYTKDYYLDRLNKLEELGAESVCIEDPCGLLTPYNCYELISFLKEKSSLPVHLNVCSLSGMSLMTVLKGIEAGASGVGTCISPVAFRRSFPSVESLTMALEGSPYATEFDLAKLAFISEYSEENILPKYRFFFNEDKVSTLDVGVFRFDIDDDTIGYIQDQIKKADDNINIEDALKKFHEIRKDLGNPPLVDPFKKMIARQTVNNLIFDDIKEDYKFVTDEIVNFVKGKYGKPEGEISEFLLNIVHQNYPDESEGIQGSVLNLNQAGKNVKGLAADIEDELIYALFPKTGKMYLKWKYLKEAPPEKTKAIGLKEAKAKLDEIKGIKEGKSLSPKSNQFPEKGPGTRSFNVFVDNDFFKVSVDPGSEPFVEFVKDFSDTQITEDIEVKEVPKPKTPGKKIKIIHETTTEKHDEKSDDFVLKAPMPGSVVSLRKKTGDRVKMGDTILILEAMKMENALKSPVEGIIKEVRCTGGDQVPKDYVLCVIEQS